MKKCLLFFLMVAFNSLQAQVTAENAFPNLTFNYPVDIQNTGVPGDNRLFVAEQSGRIRVFQNQANTSSSSVFLDIRNKVNYVQGDEKGFSGFAFHPNYRQNGYFYVSYTGNRGGLIEVIIERYTVNFNNPNQANANTGCVVLSFVKNQNNSNHNGGSIAFGPDGFLYIAVGDGGGAGDPQRNAQNLNSLYGKILRIDINTSCPGYAIPSGNPFIFSAGRNEIYAYGLRNPWRMSFDFNTNRLWAADVGQGQSEEINIIRSGRNYGWNRYEAFNTFSVSTPNPPNPTFPTYTYNHFQGDLSITGGYVYRGSQISNANLFGKYVFADFISGRVWSLEYNEQTGATNRALLFDSNFNISSFGQDINREIYFVAYGPAGRLYKLVEPQSNTNPNPNPNPNPNTTCSVSTGNCSINLNGLNGSDFIKIYNASFQEVWRCSPFSDSSPCNSTETVSGLGNGNYFVDACGELASYTISGCNGGTPNNAGACSVSTGNCSINLNGLNGGDFVKVYNSSFQEVWRCSPFSDSSPCNSTETVTGLSNGNYFVDACGELESYTLSGCGQTGGQASGGGQSSGGADCSNVQFIGEAGQIRVSNLNAQSEVIDIIGANTGWVIVPICNFNCQNPTIISNLRAGEYRVKLQMFGNDGSYCFREENVNVLSSSSNRTNGLANLSNADLVHLYPNPARESINILLDKGLEDYESILLYNYMGDELLEITAEANNHAREIKIDLSQFINGIYQVVIRHNSRPSVVKKVVVARLY